MDENLILGMTTSATSEEYLQSLMQVLQATEQSNWETVQPHSTLSESASLIFNKFRETHTTMTRDEVLEIIAAHREQLQAMGVKSLDLFGSVARDEARPDSDVDFLVEFDRSIGLFEFIEVRLYLQDILGCSVDMGTLQALREHLREPVLQDVIHAL